MNLNASILEKPTGPCMTLEEYEATVANDERVAVERKHAEWLHHRREPFTRAKNAAIRELRAIEKLEAAVRDADGFQRWRSVKKGEATPPNPSLPSGSHQKEATSPRIASILLASSDSAEVPSPKQAPRRKSVVIDSSDSDSDGEAEKKGAEEATPVVPLGPAPWRPLSAGSGGRKRGVAWMPSPRACLPLADEAVVETSSVEWKDWRPSRVQSRWRPASASARLSASPARDDRCSSCGPQQRTAGQRPLSASGAAGGGQRHSFTFTGGLDVVGPRVRAAVIRPPPVPAAGGAAARPASAQYHRWSVVRATTDIRGNDTCGIVGKILAADTDLTKVHEEKTNEALDINRVDRFGSIRGPKGSVSVGRGVGINRQVASLEYRMEQRMKAATRLWAPKKDAMPFGVK
jgi:hypothetical protein